MISGLLLLAGCSSSQQAANKERANKKPKSSLTYSVSKTAVPVKPTLHQTFQKWRGVPYRFGGVDDQGIDCSAFTRTIFQESYGMELPRSTYEQVELGKEISQQELQPGDVVFFRTGRNARHNGVYVGNGKFAHASTSVGVTISRLDNVYWRSRYWQARRLIDHE